MKKKIIEYIPRIQDGGAETLVKDYALLIDKNEFEMIILCEDYKKESANYKTLVENGINIVALYGKHSFVCKALQRMFGQKFVSILLKKELARLKPEIIHIHLEALEAFSYISDYLEDVKLFYTCHNVPELKIGNKRPKERDACKFLIKNNNLQIIALHDEMKCEINRMFGINNTIVVKNGINFDRFSRVDESKESIRKELNIPTTSFVIGNVGRFNYQKNHDFLIDVFNCVLKKNDDSFLLLVGNGPLEKEIRKKIKNLKIENKVIILSHRKDIPKLIKCMDEFVFPSRYEGLGIVLIEAQYCNIPCIISDKVPNDAIRSGRISILNLDEMPEIWAEECLSQKRFVKEYNDINEYNMINIVKELETIYVK